MRNYTTTHFDRSPPIRTHNQSQATAVTTYYQPQQSKTSYIDFQTKIRQPPNQCLSGIVVITTVELSSATLLFRFCAGSNISRGVWEFCYGEKLRKWFRLEERLNTFRRSTIPQKQFIIINVSSSSTHNQLLPITTSHNQPQEPTMRHDQPLHIQTLAEKFD